MGFRLLRFLTRSDMTACVRGGVFVLRCFCVVQGGGADDSYGLGGDPGGGQTGGYLPRPGHAAQPAVSHDAAG